MNISTNLMKKIDNFKRIDKKYDLCTPPVTIAYVKNNKRYPNEMNFLKQLRIQGKAFLIQTMYYKKADLKCYKQVQGIIHRTNPNNHKHYAKGQGDREAKHLCNALKHDNDFDLMNLVDKTPFVLPRKERLFAYFDSESATFYKLSTKVDEKIKNEANKYINKFGSNTYAKRASNNFVPINRNDVYKSAIKIRDNYIKPYFQVNHVKLHLN